MTQIGREGIIFKRFQMSGNNGTVNWKGNSKPNNLMGGIKTRANGDPTVGAKMNQGNIDLAGGNDYYYGNGMQNGLNVHGGSGEDVADFGDFRNNYEITQGTDKQGKDYTLVKHKSSEGKGTRLYGFEGVTFANEIYVPESRRKSISQNKNEGIEANNEGKGISGAGPLPPR